MVEKILPVLISVILASPVVVAQKSGAITAGPSLANTMDWLNVNIINVSLKDRGQYRQKFTYDLENQCQCRFLVKSLDSIDNLITNEYTLNLGVIDPDKINPVEEIGVSTIKLNTLNGKNQIKLFSNGIESQDNAFIIYDQHFDNALRLSKALKHVVRLCQRRE